MHLTWNMVIHSLHLAAKWNLNQPNAVRIALNFVGKITSMGIKKFASCKPRWQNQGPDELTEIDPMTCWAGRRGSLGRKWTDADARHYFYSFVLLFGHMNMTNSWLVSALASLAVCSLLLQDAGLSFSLSFIIIYNNIHASTEKVQSNGV